MFITRASGYNGGGRNVDVIGYVGDIDTVGDGDPQGRV